MTSTTDPKGTTAMVNMQKDPRLVEAVRRAKALGDNWGICPPDRKRGRNLDLSVLGGTVHLNAAPLTADFFGTAPLVRI